MSVYAFHPSCLIVPWAGPPGRGNWEMRGNGPRPGQTLLTLPEGDGVGDWVGEARGLVSWVLAWTQGGEKRRWFIRSLTFTKKTTSHSDGVFHVYLWSVVRFVEFSWLAGPLLYAVVLAGVPLDQRRVLGRLWSIGDTELHDHHPRPRRWYSWDTIQRDVMSFIGQFLVTIHS